MRTAGWHNFEPDLKLIQAQLRQLIAQAQSLSKAIGEVLSTEKQKEDEHELANHD